MRECAWEREMRGRKAEAWRTKKGRNRKGHWEHFMLQRRNSWRSSFRFLNLVSSCGHGYEIIIMSTAYLTFSPLESNKHTRWANIRWEMHNKKKEWLFRINGTSECALFSLPHTVLEAAGETVDGAMDYPACMGWPMWTESEAWRTQIVSAKAKGILQQRADLKDWSRLKLIEIPFVVFGVFYVGSLSLSLSLSSSLSMFQ